MKSTAAQNATRTIPAMKSPILTSQALGFPWPTIDPFLFCAHHDDAYPPGNEHFGPKVSLQGRDMGQDFSRKDGWSMYHGRKVPGFPSHPHRGFETVTIVRKGFIDHSDSIGAAARFGEGDVQWLTAGKGIVHSEMFPLLQSDQPNPLELFQIWVNLPARNKMVEPHFTMFWNQDIPRLALKDDTGRAIDIAVIAGAYPQETAGNNATSTAPITVPTPPPSSWASDESSDLAIWTIKLAPHAKWQLPTARLNDVRRSLYFFKGQQLHIAGQPLNQHAALELDASQTVTITNGDLEAEFLLLQGKPINEPVAQHGPFVMNTPQEIRQAIQDYQRTQFGGWPWPDEAPVHGTESKRFVRR
jgi:quercetin 2,3-dioxygenase